MEEKQKHYEENLYIKHEKEELWKQNILENLEREKKKEKFKKLVIMEKDMKL